MTTALAAAALCVATVALLCAALAWRRKAPPPVLEPVDALPEDVQGLREEVAALRAELVGSLRHLSVVRYDAFDDVGGHLSWTVAILDDGGDGVLLTSIHGRNEARSYAKQVTGWSSEQSLSQEERQALTLVRPQ